MDLSGIYEKYLPLIRQYALPITLGVIGLIFFVYGLIALTGHTDSKKDIVFESADDSQPFVKSDASQAAIMIDVEGAVRKPGVYKLPQDARIQDAVIAGGGFSEDADKDKIAVSLNLAAKLTDGAKIYIPVAGGQIAAAAGQNILGDSSNSININTASMDQLDSLSGIGPVTAQKIIDNRPYSDIAELLNKKIVGQKVFDQIKGKISVY